MEGSSGPFNALRKAPKEPPIDDAPVTALHSNPKAQSFKALLQKLFPNLTSEGDSKSFPVLLNVVEGVCMEIPFGGSMINRQNSFSAITMVSTFSSDSSLPLVPFWAVDSLS